MDTKKIPIGKIKEVDLRLIWKKEAKSGNDERDLNSWLFKNLDHLNDQLNMNLSGIGLHKKVGSFEIDILARNEEEDFVIIENQLEKGNHSHLGQLLTYMVGEDAKIGIWICKDINPLHQKTIEWLNEEISTRHFYLVKLQAQVIEKEGYESLAAPNFTLITGPSQELRDVGAGRKVKEETSMKNRQFWEEWIELDRERKAIFSSISAKPEGNVEVTTGYSNIKYKLWLFNDSCYLSLVFTHPDPEINVKRKEAFVINREEFEKQIGFESTEDTRDIDLSKKNQIIYYRVAETGRLLAEKWTEAQVSILEHLEKFVEKVRPFLSDIQQIE